MVIFVVLAAALTVAGVVVVAVPLLRRVPAQLPPAPWAAFAAAGVLVIGSAVTYAALSNWSWRAEPAADSPQTMVAQLARKLERNPDDLRGWLMLGQSYVVLQQYPLARRAFERADRLAGGKNADALVGEAQALVMGDEAQLDGRGGRLIEQALALDPNSGKALFFGAAAALRHGDLRVSRDRFVKLLALDPPPNIKPLIEQQVAAIDQRLAGGAPAPSGQPAAAGPTQATPTHAEAAVRIQVVLSPTLSSAAAGTAPLFVFVRDPAQPGPPLAVKRLQSQFPQTVELTASDSMVPGRVFAAGQKVQVVARIARSGNPVAASGDPFGEVAYLVGRDGLVNVVIDRVTP
jgi:cytochrome c-type biogenesis protein CcmH